MAATARHYIKQTPTDVWSSKEKLALASSVKRIGDNNWVSVSRAIKPYGESDRPLDWFSQKNCALQYSDLLDKVETPKRKRGERDLTEAPGDVITRKLTIERIEELKRIVQEEQERFKKLKECVEQLMAGQIDDRLDEMQADMEREKKATEEAEKKWAEDMVVREAKLGKNRRLITDLKVKIEAPEICQDSPTDTQSMSQEEESNPSILSGCLSPALSTASQDIKPVIEGPGVALGDHDTLIAKKEPKEEYPAPLLGGASGEGDAGLPLPKTENKDTLFCIGGVKEEPCEVAEEVVIQDENTDMEDTITETKSTDPEDESEQSEDEISIAGQSEPPGVHDDEQEIDVHVVEDKDDKDLDSYSEGPGKYDDPPLSPASSVMSNDTDSGMLPSGYRGRGRRGRGGKSRRGRTSRRLTSRKMEDDKLKESETSSKAESSDDGGDPSLLESDDTASNYTGRNQMSFTESVPNSPASIAPGDTEDEKAHKIWKKSIMLVWRAAANHKYANVFSHPVTEEIAPGYHSIVIRPMDLSVVKKNIENGQIRTTAEFQRDMMLMFTNATMYNNSDHDVHQMASEMYNDVMRHIEQYVHTQIMVQGGGEPKLLRTSRRSEVHSDKEDEPKRKRTTSDQDAGGKIKKRKA